MPKVSAEHKEAVRRHLVEAAARVMARQEPLTTRAITTEADVSAGTLYNYFDGLSDVIEAAAEWFLQSEWRQFSLEVDPDGPYGGLMDVLDEFVLTPPVAADALLPRLRGRLDVDEEVYVSIRRFNRFLVDLVAPLVADGADSGHVVEDLDPEALVELLDILREGMIVRHAQDSFVTGFGEVSAALRLVLERGAVRRPPPSGGNDS